MFVLIPILLKIDYNFMDIYQSVKPININNEEKWIFALEVNNLDFL